MTLTLGTFLSLNQMPIIISSLKEIVMDWRNSGFSGGFLTRRAPPGTHVSSETSENSGKLANEGETSEHSLTLCVCVCVCQGKNAESL